MHHKIVQTVLEYGYGETFGEDVVAETFQNFLISRDRNESQVTATDVNISDFLDFFLQQHEGGVLGDTDDEDDPEPQGLISYFDFMCIKFWASPFHCTPVASACNDFT